MTDDNIRDIKLQYDINREAAKISTFLSDKIHKYEYLAGEEILPFDQKQMIEQAKENISKNKQKQLKIKKKTTKKTIKKYGKQLVQCNDLVKKETFAN